MGRPTAHLCRFFLYSLASTNPASLDRYLYSCPSFNRFLYSERSPPPRSPHNPDFLSRHRWAGPLSVTVQSPARPYARFYSGPGWWKGEKEHCPYLPSSAFLSAFGTRANSAFTRASVFCCSNCVCPALIF